MSTQARNHKQLPPIRGHGKSPLLERRSQAQTVPLPARLDDVTTARSPRSGGLQAEEYESFRNLAIGSPIPTLGTDCDPTSPGRSSNEKTGFPFITIQKCDDSESPGSRSPRQKALSPATHTDLKKVLPGGSSSHGPAGGGMGVPGSPATSPRSPASPLLAPATPPGQPHAGGAKQYVVYNKDGQQTVRSYSREDLSAALPHSPEADTHPMSTASSAKGHSSPRDVRTEMTTSRANQKPTRLQPLGGR